MAENTLAKLPAPNRTIGGLLQIPGLRQALILIGVAAAVALGVMVAVWSRSPIYAPLYTNLDEGDASQVVTALQAANADYRLDPSGRTVLVAEGEVARLRLALAAQGLPAGSGAGSAGRGSDSPFGLSDAAEKARQQQRLEAELVTSISALQPVKGARVHLALPKQSAFVRDRRPASASVVVSLLPGRKLDDSQVSAIVHLVAASVPELDPSQVSIIDQQGNLLTSGRGDGADALADSRFRFTRNVEQTYVARVVELLTPLVGPGRVRAQVAADLDFTETERTSEQFSPQDSVLRSEQVSSEERNGSLAVATGIPGALSNQPPTTGQQPTAAEPNGGAPAPELASMPPGERNSSATRNYEIDRTVSHVREPLGRVRRLSVAVVVDNKASVNEDGETITEPLSQSELAQMTELVRSAVGFDAARGDTLSVINAPFHVEPDIEAPPAPPLWQQPAIREIGKQLLGAIVLLVIALSVVRPLLRALLASSTRAPAAQALPTVQIMAGDVDIDAPMRTGGAGSVPALPKIGFEQKVGNAKRMVSEDPRQVAQVVKTWLAEDGV